MDVYFPKSEFRVLSDQLSGVQTNNRAEAMTCLRVLQRLLELQDLHAHANSKWNYDTVLRNKQHHTMQYAICNTHLYKIKAHASCFFVDGLRELTAANRWRQWTSQIGKGV